MHLQFVETESTFDYFEATRAYLDRYGKPIAFYSDKHAVFRVNKKDAAGEASLQFFISAMLMSNAATPTIKSSVRSRPTGRLWRMQSNKVVYVTDVRYQSDVAKCRREAYGDGPIPANTFLVISGLAVSGMLLEIDVTAVVGAAINNAAPPIIPSILSRFIIGLHDHHRAHITFGCRNASTRAPPARHAPRH